MDFLNEDVIELILDHCGGWWQRDIARLARVSPAWTRPAQLRLFASPSLFTFNACNLLARTLEDNTRLRELVRNLDLRPTSGESSSSIWILSGVMRLLAMTRLESLTLAEDLSVSAERFLRFIGSPQSLKALRIEGSRRWTWLEAPRASLEWSADLPLRFSNLQSLTLVGPLSLDVDGEQFDDSDLLSSPLQGCRLEELHLYDVELADSSDAIRTLLPSASSWRKIRALSITMHQLSQVATFNYESLFPLISESLETLVVRTQRESFTSIISIHELLTSVDAPIMMRNLRSLECAHIAVFLEDLQDVMPVIEQLDIDDMAYRLQRLDAFLSVIAEQRFSRLKRLILRGDRCSQESIAHNPEAISTLQSLCAQNKIIFKCLT